MDFYDKPEDGGIALKPRECVYLRPRSLLVFTSQAYHNHLHGIAAVRGSLALLDNEGGHQINNSLQTAMENMEASVVNADLAYVKPGNSTARLGTRCSLTFRRVLRTRQSLLRL